MSFQLYFVRQTGFPNNFTGNFFCLRVLCCLRCVNQLPKLVCLNIFELALDRNISIQLIHVYTIALAGFYHQDGRSRKALSYFGNFGICPNMGRLSVKLYFPILECWCILLCCCNYLSKIAPCQLLALGAQQTNCIPT